MKEGQNKDGVTYFVEFGEKLRLAREALGLQVTEVASRLLISKQRVIEIENGDYSNITSQLYLRWYLNSYANIVGLSQDDIPYILNEYAGDLDSNNKVMISNTSILQRRGGRESKKNSKFYRVLFLSLVIVMVLYLPNREHDNEQIRYFINYLQQKFITPSDSQ